MDLPGQLQSALGSAYLIECPLGGGGMATVCRPHDQKPDRTVDTERALFDVTQRRIDPAWALLRSKPDFQQLAAEEYR